MDIKRFVAPDMRQAIRRVREEHGPDAVILKSERGPDGVEVLSATGFDENMVDATFERERKRREDGSPRPVNFHQADTRQRAPVQPSRKIINDNPRSPQPKSLPGSQPSRLSSTQATSTAVAPAETSKIVQATELNKLQQELQSIHELLKSTSSQDVSKHLAIGEAQLNQLRQELESIQGLLKKNSEQISSQPPAAREAHMLRLQEELKAIRVYLKASYKHNAAQKPTAKEAQILRVHQELMSIRDFLKRQSDKATQAPATARESQVNEVCLQIDSVHELLSKHVEKTDSQPAAAREAQIEELKKELSSVHGLMKSTAAQVATKDTTAKEQQLVKVQRALESMHETITTHVRQIEGEKPTAKEDQIQSLHKELASIRDTLNASVERMAAEEPVARESQMQKLWNEMQDLRGLIHERTERPDTSFQEAQTREMRHELKSIRAILQSELPVVVRDSYAHKHPLRAAILRKLEGMGIAKGIAHRLSEKIEDSSNPQQAWRDALTHFSTMIPHVEHDLMKRGGKIALVGPTGVGKTTTAAKLAAQFSKRHGRQSVALIGTDCQRAGAQRELLALGHDLGVYTLAASSPAEVREALEVVADRKLVILDTPGMGWNDPRLVNEYTVVKDQPSVEPWLVLAANTQSAALQGTITKFSSLGPRGCILTKVDECAALGESLSAIITQGLPLGFVSQGQCVPDDLVVAQGDMLVKRMVGLDRSQRSQPRDVPTLVNSNEASNHNEVAHA